MTTWYDEDLCLSPVEMTERTARDLELLRVGDEKAETRRRGVKAPKIREPVFRTAKAASRGLAGDAKPHDGSP